MRNASARHAGARTHLAPILAASLGGLTVMGCAGAAVDLHPVPGRPLRVQLESGKVVSLPLERYLIGSIVAEADFRGLDPDAARRVAEIQAVLVRTYALANTGRHGAEGFDLCATTHCQVYDPDGGSDERVRELARSAARNTAGLVLVHGDRPINAVYHAHCGGHTSDASVPWGGAAPPYLRGVPDPFCVREDPAPWRFEASLKALEKALARTPRTRVAGLEAIRILATDAAGRAVEVVLDGDEHRTVRGERLRAVLVSTFGVRSIRSTHFKLHRAGAMIAFEGRGFGHGVGLCQRGARVRARHGHTVEAVLAHYYPGTHLERYDRR